MNSFSSRIALIGVGAVLFAAGVAGCGGSSDDDSGDALSKDDFIAQTNEICASVTADTEATADEFAEAFQAGDYEAASAALNDATDSLEAAIDEVDALGAPEGDEDTIDEFISLSRDQVDINREAADAAADGDQEALQSAVDEIDAAESKSDQIADDYGLTDCGSAA